MSGIVIAVGLVVLIIAHELGHFLAAKAFKLFVHEFGIGFPPKLIGKKWGETEYTLNVLPIGGFVRIAGEDDEEQNIPTNRLLSRQLPWRRALVIAAGVSVNFAVAWILFSSIYVVGTPHVVVIADVEQNSPAAQAGLQSGDIVRGYDKVDVFASKAKEAAGNTFTFEVQRAGDIVQIAATPRISTPEAPGALGVSLVEGGIDAVGFLRAPYEGLKTTWNMTVATVSGFIELLGRLFSGSVPQDVVGPVGIVSTAGQVGGIGVIYLIQMLAVISVNLAVLNLLPIPALDGGRLYLTIVEWISGKKLPKWIEVRINAITFLVLIALMVLLTARDVLRLF
jgi:regulator of sigma E protease